MREPRLAARQRVPARDEQLALLRAFGELAQPRRRRLVQETRAADFEVVLEVVQHEKHTLGLQQGENAGQARLVVELAGPTDGRQARTSGGLACSASPAPSASAMAPMLNRPVVAASVQPSSLRRAIARPASELLPTPPMPAITTPAFLPMAATLSS